MTISLNGWTALANMSDPRLKWQPIPGTTRKVLVRKLCGPLFGAFCADWNRLMPARLKLTSPQTPVDGWEYRDPRLTTGIRLSNHASGTAVDLAYNVLKADQKPHMTATERRIMEKILDTYTLEDGRRIFRWGGYWNAVDEMHTEIAPGMTTKDVRAVIKRLSIDPNGDRPL